MQNLQTSEVSFLRILFPGMVKALYRDEWTLYHHMGSVLDRLRKDMMVVVSEMDKVVPVKMGKALWEAST